MADEIDLDGFTVFVRKEGNKLYGSVKEIPSCTASAADEYELKIKLREKISEYIISHTNFSKLKKNN